MTETYDFTQVVDLRGDNTRKWGDNANILPMDLADMDFLAAPAIQRELITKVQTGFYSYQTVPDQYFAAVTNWFKQRHGVTVPANWQIFASGIRPTVNAIIRELTQPGDKIIVQKPGYSMGALTATGRKLVQADLVYDAEQLAYQLDNERLAQQLADPKVKLMILCNPHNPTGKVWTKDEITAIVRLCTENDVVLLSDEAHGDLTFNDGGYFSALAVPKALRSSVVAVVSPSKAFNLAALQAATVIVPDDQLRADVALALRNYALNEPNLLAVAGTIAAYQNGATWLDQLLVYLRANRQEVAHFLDHNIPTIKWVPTAGTTMMWLDISALNTDAQAFSSFLIKEVGLKVTAGNAFGADQFIRLAIGCPQTTLDEGLRRLQRGVVRFLQQRRTNKWASLLS